jgi:hypothetical protein
MLLFEGSPGRRRRKRFLSLYLSTSYISIRNRREDLRVHGASRADVCLESAARIHGRDLGATFG